MLCDVLMYGALWGICESTIGYVIHLFPIHLSTFVMLPLATFFMYQIYKKTGKYSSVIYISLISAFVKLINLFTPISIDKVINPIISICLEGVAFIVILHAFENSKLKEKILLKTIMFNTFWRAMYILYLLLVPAWMFEKSALASFSGLLDFLVVSNIKSGIGVYICFKYCDKINIKIQKNIEPYLTFRLMYN